MIELREIKEADAVYLSPTDRHDMQVQADFYVGYGRQHVIEHCRRLRLGLADDQHPFESQLLGHIIDSLAVVYRSPPTRWLIDETGERLPEQEPEVRDFRRTYDRAQVDTVMREVDRQRCLHRQCVVRVMASEAQRRVMLVPFTPLHVYRMPDPTAPTDIAQDQAIAIGLSGDRYEVWERGPEGWVMRLVDAEGRELADQPMAGADPLEVLPMVLAYDGVPTSVWQRPKAARTSYLLKLSALMNEIMSAVRWDSHPEVSYEQDATPTGRGVRPSDMPQRYGPGVRPLLPPGVRANLLSMAPQIAPALDAIDRLEQKWLRSESLPTDTFRQSQNVTALGLRQLAQPLQERQESLRQPAIQTERDLWRALRATHNLYASQWRQPQLEDYDIEVELGPIDIPTDPRVQIETLNLMALAHAISPIQYLQRVHNVTRDEAIRLYEQIAQDREDYPLEVRAQPGDVVPEPPDPNPAASVTQAMLADGGLDDERRESDATRDDD